MELTSSIAHESVECDFNGVILTNLKERLKYLRGDRYTPSMVALSLKSVAFFVRWPRLYLKPEPPVETRNPWAS